jgi:hypothetical protein
VRRRQSSDANCQPIKKKPCLMRCKPSSVPRRGGHTATWRRPFVLTRLHRRALPVRESGLPAIQLAWIMPSSLLGLAPGGVYHADRLTAAAVRSYRTFSPLPEPLRAWAVYFLRHFPGPAQRQVACARRWALPTTAIQRCSDFPPRYETGAVFHASDANIISYPTRK